ncbi:MAG: membrane lipoprotein lipid attachment site-containing protein [Pseudomonadota bacterium]
MRKIIIALVAGLMLAACATPYDDQARLQHDMERIISVYGPACEKLGYAPNTDQWRNCMLQLSIKDDADHNSAYYQHYTPYWRYRGRYWW